VTIVLFPEDPESIYKTELKKIRSTGIPMSESLAWAGDSPSDKVRYDRCGGLMHLLCVKLTHLEPIQVKALPQSLARVEDNLVSGVRYMAQHHKRRATSSSVKSLEQEIASDVTREVGCRRAFL
jgi:hypothetical protein